jgi:hypothetical protein
MTPVGLSFAAIKISLLSYAFVLMKQQYEYASMYPYHGSSSLMLEMQLDSFQYQAQ